VPCLATLYRHSSAGNEPDNPGQRRPDHGKKEPTAMQRTAFRALGALLLMIAGLGMTLFTPSSAAAVATPQGQLVDLPCATDVYAQVLGKSLPETADGQALVSVRITIQPGGGFNAHTHPGTVNAYIEKGEFTFTLLDDGHEMAITRGDTGETEMLTPNEATVLNPGDSFVETGMVHEAWNLGDEPVEVLVSALIDSELGLTQCVDVSASAKHHS
jgi:quercetin dioxygenase-like cupin family protein